MAIQLDLGGKVALVTGGSRGIGAAVCVRLAEAGCDIAFTYHPEEDKPDILCQDLLERGVKAVHFAADVTDGQRAKEVVESVIELAGEIDIMVCNAGIAHNQVLWKMDHEEWSKVIDVNLTGSVNYLMPFSLHARQHPARRSVVFISSINGIRGKRGLAAYSASKAGIIGLARTAAKDLACWQVNCNVIAPGMVDTEMVANLPEAVRATAIAETLTGRIAAPGDIADAVLFVASGLASHITGAVIPVDGGQLI